MRIPASFYLLSVYLLSVDLLSVAGSTQDLADKGRAELRRLQGLASRPRYGACWSGVLRDVNTLCKELTEDSQSRMALRFTHCHLERSGRAFPACPEGSEVSHCTTNMDTVAFNAYTEFFTHTHSICHYLQSEAWQQQADNTIHRLTETSAGVAEQLQSTRQMAEDLVEAQSAALLAQEEILRNGDELRHTLRASTQGLRELFSEVTLSSRDQQVVLSELFNRVSFLHNFLLLEAHTLGSGLYNGAALCASFLLTSSQRTSRARLVLFGLVCVNVYLERMIYQWILDSASPAHQHMELVSVYVSVLRRVMVCLGLVVLFYVAVRYRDPAQESLAVLAQLKETHSSLQRALSQAESLSALGERQRSGGGGGEERQRSGGGEERQRRSGGGGREEQRRREQEKWRRAEEERLRRSKEKRGGGEEDGMLIWTSMMASDSSVLSHHSHGGWSNNSVLSSTVSDSTVAHTQTTHNALLPGHNTHTAAVSPSRCPRSSSSSCQVYSILVEDTQPRYSLRKRKSLQVPETR